MLQWTVGKWSGTEGSFARGYGLCHGVAGNAYTFLQLFRLTSRAEYFNRAVKVSVPVLM